MKKLVTYLLFFYLIFVNPVLAHSKNYGDDYYDSATTGAMDKAQARQAMQEQRKAESHFKSHNEFFSGTDEEKSKVQIEKQREEAELNQTRNWQRQREVQIAEARENEFRLRREKELASTDKPKDDKPKEIFDPTHKIYLKNGQEATCLITKRDNNGVWANIDQGSAVYFHNSEIKKIEDIPTKPHPEKKMDESNSSQTNQLSDLEKLADLKNKGILTEEEFNAKKKKILGL